MNTLMGMPSGEAPETMTSLEISEVVGSRHDKVKQSIERLAARGAIQLPPTGEVKNHLGQSVEVFKVAERDSYVVVAQLSPEFTARLVDYWQAHKNSESIVHIRKRIWTLFGLSGETVDAVMRQSPYAPKPAGMVKNEHAEADGATYAVYWKKDVTATFERFVSECRHSAGKLFTHPFIEGRFRLIRRE